MFSDFRSSSLVVEPRFGLQNIWADRFVRESFVDFVLHRCFMMRSKEIFSKENQERDGVKKKEKGRKEKKKYFFNSTDIILRENIV